MHHWPSWILLNLPCITLPLTCNPPQAPTRQSLGLEVPFRCQAMQLHCDWYCVLAWKAGIFWASCSTKRLCKSSSSLTSSMSSSPASGVECPSNDTPFGRKELLKLAPSWVCPIACGDFLACTLFMVASANNIEEDAVHRLKLHWSPVRNAWLQEF